MFGVKAYVIVSALLFGMGIYGALARRHAIAVLISIELMFAAAALNFVTFSRLYPASQGVAAQAFAVFIIAAAAAETVVALALIFRLHRRTGSAALEGFNLLKW